LAAMSEGVGLIDLQLVSKISNLCDHNQPTLQTDRQTDRQTDGQTTCDRKTAICTKVHCAVMMLNFYLLITNDE